jgi:hypothetical protein
MTSLVSQCPFDLYWAGMKVYRAYWTGGRPAPQTTLIAMEAKATMAAMVILPVEKDNIIERTLQSFQLCVCIAGGD